MSAIILATFNARYQHAAFGLRYLLANLGELRAEAALLEFDLQRNPEQAAEQILARQPRVVGLAVYIWNVSQTAALVAALRRSAPNVTVVLGGPEVSYETETHPLTPLADFVICGEADLAFADLCRAVLARQPPREKILHPLPPEPARLALPYGFYSDHDLATRFTYLEASRGCPFGCEYCVSAIDRGVRRFAWARLQPEFENLLARGARRIKFVDRTFNLDLELGCAVLEFFYTRAMMGVQVHIEITPACLTEAWRELLRRAPPGLLRLEVGVQTFDAEVSARVGRPQSAMQAEEALRFLRAKTNALIHADLIAGLPGQTLGMFAADFDRMIALQPHEIQVGILKRLRGTAIGRHDAEWGARWKAEPPYDLLENKLLDAATLTQLKRFARCWEILGNRGRFEQTLPLLWSAPGDSPFSKVGKFTEQLVPRFGKLHGIPLLDFARALFDFMADFQGLEKERVAAALRMDLARSGAPHLPKWVREI